MTTTITRTRTADGLTLTTADLTHPQNLPVTATITLTDGDLATIVISDATGDAGDPLEGIPATLAENLATRMLALYGYGA